MLEKDAIACQQAVLAYVSEMEKTAKLGAIFKLLRGVGKAMKPSAMAGSFKGVRRLMGTKAFKAQPFGTKMKMLFKPKGVGRKFAKGVGGYLGAGVGAYGLGKGVSRLVRGPKRQPQVVVINR